MGIAPLEECFQHENLFSSLERTWLVDLEPLAIMVCRDLGYTEHVSPRTNEPWPWCVSLLEELSQHAFQVDLHEFYLKNLKVQINQELKIVHLDAEAVAQKWLTETVLFLGSFIGLRALANNYPYLYHVKHEDEFDYTVRLYDISRTDVKCYYLTHPLMT